jgi:hypothetical protein
VFTVAPTQPPAQRVPGSSPGRSDRCKDNHSPPSNAEAENKWSDTSAPHQGIETENLYFLRKILASKIYVALSFDAKIPDMKHTKQPLSVTTLPT